MTSERRRDILAQPEPPGFRHVLEQRIWQFRHLTADEQQALIRKARIIAAEKRWVGREGLTVTEEVKATIAGQAALLILGLDPHFCFEHVSAIFVFPGAFENFHLGGPIFGVAEHYGSIVLSWEHVTSEEEAREHRNLVIHEFAHYIDEIGAMDGVPPVDSQAEYDQWYDVTERELRRLLGSLSRGEHTVLDEYGASDYVEFFAVATESFFERAQSLAREHPDLYALLRKFYRQDTATRFPEREFDGGQMVWSPEADASGFAEGALHLAQGRYDAAVHCFTRALRDDPDDDEALQHRALAYVGLGRGREALADAERAAQMAPAGSLDARLARGAALYALRDVESSVQELSAVIKHARYVRPAAYYWRARALADLGQHEQAISDLDDAIALDDTEGRYFFHRALSLASIGRHEEAEEDRQVALDLDPDVGRRG